MLHGVRVPNSTVGGMGVVICDSNGSFIRVASFVFQKVFSPAQIKVLTIRVGLELVIEGGLQNIVFKSDSLQIVSALNDSFTDSSTVGPIIEDAKPYMEMIVEDSITHVRQDANSVVHRIARLSFKHPLKSLWLGAPRGGGGPTYNGMALDDAVPLPSKEEKEKEKEEEHHSP
ncbi:hypothetical protein DVH24_000468 [Malus domestica]|uniref:RNase H type-1 domain-containing protein n=1 Tax=Malus domestica TaxID=3750 RepID=A0A498IZL7_MALDO|nr:hypothetical protein DVH24_000468 [Malus domestica]